MTVPEDDAERVTWTIVHHVRFIRMHGTIETGATNASTSIVEANDRVFPVS